MKGPLFLAAILASMAVPAGSRSAALKLTPHPVSLSNGRSFNLNLPKGSGSASRRKG